MGRKIRRQMSINTTLPKTWTVSLSVKEQLTLAEPAETGQLKVENIYTRFSGNSPFTV